MDFSESTAIAEYGKVAGQEKIMRIKYVFTTR
jgi:hypothetical protein